MEKQKISSLKNAFPIALFFLAIIFYILYQLATQPHWMLDGEMWAEMATNYFPNANSPSYLTKFFSTDSGYIPVPQRIIAFAGTLLNLPASVIPYFYTWSATVLTALLVSVFCLAPFRHLIKSDALRFFTVIVILMTADFETRTFINFTYFSAFFIAIITALAWTDNSKPLPLWSWLIPILMISKPAVLAALPAMIGVATLRKSNFRSITLLAVILCIGQIIQMKFSQPLSNFSSTHETSLVEKIITTVNYFFGILAHYILGPNVHFNKIFSNIFGIAIFCFCCYLIFKKKNHANALIAIGLSLLFFNVLLNSFALSSIWNHHIIPLTEIAPQRHIIVGYFACILVIVGLIDILTKAPQQNKIFLNIGAIIFIIWFAESGWLPFLEKNNREPSSPVLNNSQWQNMSASIDSNISPLCVPVDPLGWIYSRNCAFLNATPNWHDGTHIINNTSFFELTPPSNLSNKTFVALAFLVKPLAKQTVFLKVNMMIFLKNGQVENVSGQRNIPHSGGLILITKKSSMPMKKISHIDLKFNVPVEIANNANGDFGSIWLGH